MKGLGVVHSGNMVYINLPTGTYFGLASEDALHFCAMVAGEAYKAQGKSVTQVMIHGVTA